LQQNLQFLAEEDVVGEAPAKDLDEDEEVAGQRRSVHALTLLGSLNYIGVHY
jgi:hypothetical protein